MDLVKEFWGILVAAVGAVAWLIRLEQKIALNAASITYLQQQRHDDLMAAREARKETTEALGHMREELGEIRRDIKELLKRDA